MDISDTEGANPEALRGFQQFMKTAEPKTEPIVSVDEDGNMEAIWVNEAGEGVKLVFGPGDMGWVVGRWIDPEIGGLTVEGRGNARDFPEVLLSLNLRRLLDTSVARTWRDTVH